MAFSFSCLPSTGRAQRTARRHRDRAPDGRANGPMPWTRHTTGAVAGLTHSSLRNILPTGDFGSASRKLMCRGSIVAREVRAAVRLDLGGREGRVARHHEQVRRLARALVAHADAGAFEHRRQHRDHGLDLIGIPSAGGAPQEMANPEKLLCKISLETQSNVSSTMLTTEVHAADIPKIFAEFSNFIGDTHWQSRVRLCKDEMRGNSFLRDFLVAENDIAFQLDHLSGLAKKSGGRVPSVACSDHGIYPAASFAAQILSFVEGLSREHRRRFERRVHGAFKNPDDMRGLRLELAIATHFLRRGQTVSWPEITGGGTFDLLIDDAGHGGLEVECKSVSNDKGRKIHRREMIDFVHLLTPTLVPVIRRHGKGLFAVLTVPGRLPTLYKQRVQLAKDLTSSVSRFQDAVLSDGTAIRIGEFDSSGIDDALLRDQSRLRAFTEAVTGTSQREAVVIGDRSGGTLALVVQSALDDELLKATFDTLSRAARQQLSRNRAGLVVAAFAGLNVTQMLSIAQQDRDPEAPPTALRMHVSRFLSSSDRDHVIGAGFLSTGELHAAPHGSLDSGGSAYYFKNGKSRYWSPEFDGLFTADH